MATMVTLSTRHQVVIPKEARKRLNLHAGDQLIVEVEEGRIVMRPRPRNYTNYMLGLGKKVWQGIDATDYMRRERESLEK